MKTTPTTSLRIAASILMFATTTCKHGAAVSTEHRVAARTPTATPVTPIASVLTDESEHEEDHDDPQLEDLPPQLAQPSPEVGPMTSMRCRMVPARGRIVTHFRSRIGGGVTSIAAHPRYGVVVGWVQDFEGQPSWSSFSLRVMAWNSLQPVGRSASHCDAHSRDFGDEHGIARVALVETPSGVAAGCCALDHDPNRGGLQMRCVNRMLGGVMPPDPPPFDTSGTDLLELVPSGEEGCIVLASSNSAGPHRCGTRELSWDEGELPQRFEGERITSGFATNRAGPDGLLYALVNDTQIAARYIDRRQHRGISMPVAVVEGIEERSRKVAIAWRNNTAWIAHGQARGEGDGMPLLSLRRWVPGRPSEPVACDLHGNITRQALVSSPDAPCIFLGWTDPSLPHSHAAIDLWCSNGIVPGTRMVLSPDNVVARDVMLTSSEGRTFVSWTENLGNDYTVRVASVVCDNGP
jgi:hypothetical protein